MPNKKKSLLRFSALALVATSPLMATAAIHTNNMETVLTTGSFYTSQNGIEGAVTPWRIRLTYHHHLNSDSVLAIRTNSQTGIVTGPYIDGFNTQREKFNIELIQYTQSVSPSIKTRLGFGKTKANLLKNAGSITPLPFSQAMSRPPLTASDMGLAIQKTHGPLNGTYTMGTAISNISNTTHPNDRTYSLFLEGVSKTPQGNIWVQYSQNNLVRLINSSHYASVGTQQTHNGHTGNATVHIGTIKGLVGFDCGYQSQIVSLKNSTIGIGYGYSKDEQRTLEISLQNKNILPTNTTISWYNQNPANKQSFNVIGVKFEYTL